MTFDWKQALGSVALSAMALSMIGTGGAVAQSKPDTIKPAPPTADKIETGQMLDKGPRRPPSVERGIKDNGVKGCTGCGITGREAAPPATGDGATPTPSVDIETGQMLDKGPRWKPSVAAQEAAPPPTGDGTAPPSAEKIETGQMLDRGCRWPKDCSKATERRAHNGPGGTPPSTAKGNNTSLILGITVGAAALAAVLASGNNNDRPTSP